MLWLVFKGAKPPGFEQATSRALEPCRAARTWQERPSASNISARGPRTLEDPLRTSPVLAINALCASTVWAQAPAQPKTLGAFEELSAPNSADGIARAQGRACCQFGILEKHGPASPVGQHLLTSATWRSNAAQQDTPSSFP